MHVVDWREVGQAHFAVGDYSWGFVNWSFDHPVLWRIAWSPAHSRQVWYIGCLWYSQGSDGGGNQVHEISNGVGESWSIHVKDRVHIQQSMLTAVAAHDSMANITIIFSDRHVNKLLLFRIFLDCVGYQQCFHFKLVCTVHLSINFMNVSKSKC